MEFKQWLEALQETKISLMHFSVRPFDLEWYKANRQGIHLTSDEYYMRRHGLTGPNRVNVTGRLKIKFLGHDVEQGRDSEMAIATQEGYDAIADSPAMNDVYVAAHAFDKLQFRKPPKTVKIVRTSKMGEIVFWVDGRRETFWMDAVHFVPGGWFSKLSDEEAYRAVLGMVEDGRAERPPQKKPPPDDTDDGVGARWTQRTLF
jgi:hypothetical protein